MDKKTYRLRKFLDDRMPEEYKRREIQYAKHELVSGILDEIPLNEYFTIRLHYEYREHQRDPEYLYRTGDEILFDVELIPVTMRHIQMYHPPEPTYTHYEPIRINWRQWQWWKYFSRLRSVQFKNRLIKVLGIFNQPRLHVVYKTFPLPVMLTVLVIVLW